MREYEYGRAGVARADLVRGAKPLVGIRRWHPHIHEGDVRPEVPDGDEKSVGIADFSDDLYAVLGEQTRDALANQRRVVGDH